MRTRPKVPTAKLKLMGGYRKDRHGDRAAEPQPVGEPEMPEGMGQDAQEHWNAVVPQLVSMGVAKSLDAPALLTMCQWWGEYQELRRTEVSKYKKITLMCCAHKQWLALASRFGLTPVDRANLQVEDKQTNDPAAEFLA